MFISKEDEVEGTPERALTPKARRTRERILEAAFGLFADRGYEATTMRDVAREAGTSLGLAYRYFASKEEFALALYERLAEESEEWARDGLDGGTIAERFERAMVVKLDQVSPHRGPLAALLSQRMRGMDHDRAAERSAGVKVESEGLFVGPDEGKALPNPIGGRMVVKVRDGDTAGSFSVHDNVIPAGSPGPLPHLHRDHEETFYVLEGELTVWVGERKITAPAGSFVVIPRGVVHRPSNAGTEPTRVLLIFSPSGMEHFFEEAAEGRIPLQTVPTDPEVLKRRAAFTEKYGYEFAELP